MDLFPLTQLASLAQKDLDTATATLVRDMAEAAVRSDLDQLLDLVEDDTVTLWGDGSPVLLLPELAVVSVSSVAMDGETLDEGTSWRLRGPGVLEGRYGGQRAAWRDGCEVEVTYTHGYATAPPAATTVALQVALRLLGNPGGLSAATIGAVNLSYGPGGVPGLLESEQRMLDPLRKGAG